MAKGNKGIVVRITGSIVDVYFDDNKLPDIFHAVTIEKNNKIYTLEVLQHIGNGIVRCISMHSTDGFSRGMPVVDTGAPISVPVGKETLGRMTNVMGEPIDNMGEIATETKWSIHHEPPHFTELISSSKILETGIKVIDLMTPYAKGGKIGLSVALALAKPCSLWNLFVISRSKITAIRFSQALENVPAKETTYGMK